MASAADSRWYCVIDACPWVHEWTPGVGEGEVWQGRYESVDESLDRAVREAALARQAAVRTHLESHDAAEVLRTIVRLRRAAGEDEEQDR